MGRTARAKRERPAGDGLDLRLLKRRMAAGFPDHAVEVVHLPTLPDELFAGMVRATAKAKPGQMPLVVAAIVAGDAVMLFGLLDIGASMVEGAPELARP